jgi:undecaprenyl-diphosphatase
MNWSTSLFESINQYAGKCGCLDALAVFFSEYLQYFLVLAFIVLLMKNFNKYQPLFLRVTAAAVLSRLVITEIIRSIWNVSRPFVGNNVNLLIEHSSSSSFPSGHASFFFAISTVVYSYNKKAGIVLLIASILVSLSRVFAGIHWPADMIAGAAVGILSGWIISKIFK